MKARAVRDSQQKLPFPRLMVSSITKKDIYLELSEDGPVISLVLGKDGNCTQIRVHEATHYDRTTWVPFQGEVTLSND